MLTSFAVVGQGWLCQRTRSRVLRYGWCAALRVQRTQGACAALRAQRVPAIARWWAHAPGHWWRWAARCECARRGPRTYTRWVSDWVRAFSSPGQARRVCRKASAAEAHVARHGPRGCTQHRRADPRRVQAHRARLPWRQLHPHLPKDGTVPLLVRRRALHARGECTFDTSMGTLVATSPW